MSCSFYILWLVCQFWVDSQDLVQVIICNCIIQQARLIGALLCYELKDMLEEINLRLSHTYFFFRELQNNRWVHYVFLMPNLQSPLCSGGRYNLQPETLQYGGGIRVIYSSDQDGRELFCYTSKICQDFNGLVVSTLLRQKKTLFHFARK